MSQKGFTGISFPFRIGIKGGVVTSSTSATEVPHIIESMQQILRTFRLERAMEPHIYSELDTIIFEQDDESTYTLLEYYITDALERLEPRIDVESVDIESEDGVVYADIQFKALSYDKVYSTKLKVGETNVDNSNP